jgi:hypothetical protein
LVKSDLDMKKTLLFRSLSLGFQGRLIIYTDN